MPLANFQQFTMNGYDLVTVLVTTYPIGGFQPEGPLYRLKIFWALKGNAPCIEVSKRKGSTVDVNCVNIHPSPEI